MALICVHFKDDELPAQHARVPGLLTEGYRHPTHLQSLRLLWLQ
jgi:hypothetical protein